MNHLTAGLLALLLLSQVANGDTQQSVDEYVRSSEARQHEAVRQIPSLLERYAATIGCAAAINPENVVRYAAKGQPVVYLAVYALDRGCSGGSAMQRPEVAVLAFGAYDNLFIDPERSRLAQARPARVERIYLKDDVLRYEGRTYTASDARCCPSEAVHGQLIFEGGVWKFSPDGRGEDGT